MNGQKAKPLLERFWKRVHKTDTCWLWTGATTRGYGQIAPDYNAVKKHMIYVHRLSWETFNGAIPPGMLVCHNCPGGDNPLCVNPDHLWLGTLRQNLADMVSKCGQARGEKNRHAKLTREQVRGIIERYNKQRTNVNRFAIARDFGISENHVYRLAAGRAWKWLDCLT